MVFLVPHGTKDPRRAKDRWPDTGIDWTTLDFLSNMLAYIGICGANGDFVLVTCIDKRNIAIRLNIDFVSYQM